VHLFAGIGTWDYSLNQAGWGDRPVITASLPCQPFSAAGKGLGKEDERHLLPAAIRFIKQSGIATCFGEQVPRAIKHGWLDDLYAEMEACGYSVGSIIAGAHSVGAAHIRQRLYWVANSLSDRPQRRIPGRQNQEWETIGESLGLGGSAVRMGDSEVGAFWAHNRESWAGDEKQKQIGGSSVSCRMGISDSAGLQQRFEASETSRHGGSYFSAGGDGIKWIYCKDGKHRPIEPSIFPLADGASGTMVYRSYAIPSLTKLIENFEEVTDGNSTQEARSMRLKGYGNAIQADLAIVFIKSFMAI
jgi:DNA (cytosine-5)-methyltransferase 1